MSETTTELARLAAPWGRELVLFQVIHEGGLAMLRLRIREGKRFTTLDLDAATAGDLAARLTAWAAAPPSDA
ncbi:MAG: hypothetical protein IT565_13810 [Rhodospirillales bacterium]|nr:hypothetical protein [Rhodospirillales bacterium]